MADVIFVMIRLSRASSAGTQNLKEQEIEEKIFQLEIIS